MELELTCIILCKINVISATHLPSTPFSTLIWCLFTGLRKKKKNCYFPAFKILWVLMRSELLRLAHRGPHNQTSLCLPGHITSSCILLSATLKSLFPWSSQALLQSAFALKGVCLSLAWIPVCKQLKCHLSSLISPQGRQLLCLWFQSHIHTS